MKKTSGITDITCSLNYALLNINAKKLGRGTQERIFPIDGNSQKADHR